MPAYPSLVGTFRDAEQTSVISNLIDDCDTWAIAQIRCHIIRAGARDELGRRVAQALTARQTPR